jgi:predicted nucleic acid-binding protein
VRPGHLLDTSVLSVLAPGRSDATPEFLDWVDQQDRSLHISAITVMEVEQGIAKLERAGGEARARANAEWLERVLVGFGGNVLPVDVDVARSGGRLSDAAFRIGRQPGAADVLIAATAKVHVLTLLTRNLKHFAALGIDVVDPLVSLPD